jgi:predicted ATPase
MEIRHLRVEAFKSLYELEAQFDHVSVITGPNGAGKSNLVDALVFLSDAYRHNLEFAVSRAGGYENIAHRRTRRAKRPVSFEIEVFITADEIFRGGLLHFGSRQRNGRRGWPKNVDLKIRHSFTFHASSQSLRADFELLDERLVVSDDHGNIIVTIDIESVTRNVSVTTAEHPLVQGEALSALTRPFVDEDEPFSWEAWGRTPGSTQLGLTGWRFFNIAGVIVDHIANIRVFQLSPQLSRTSGVPTPNAELDRFGQNLPGAADHLKKASPKAWSEVREAMQYLVPGLEDIVIRPTEDRRLAVLFRESGVGRPWHSSEVSDGTIQAFALLVALYDPRASMLVIEEPENAVHPWILRFLLQITLRADRQVLLTTHSPVVIDYVSAETVKLMWMVEGRSQLARFIDLDTDLRPGLLDGSISLYELYASGYFPQSVPRGLELGGKGL